MRIKSTLARTEIDGWLVLMVGGAFFAPLFFCGFYAVFMRFFAFSCVRVGLLALPLCGAAPTFLCSGKEK
ncbi:hypothetical protein [Paraburkholderia tagetis]|uniref:Uncharacterized protein n=1 Tax=Paraburkholderia tagetis TaxID=2913261 RepID=A0A9X1RPI0_9BURK|nr:hypothetical protein [Paraburkholderia tagetis]MCG5073292.1 hypothetical protein [Paraburkholderia tagetis]